MSDRQKRDLFLINNFQFLIKIYLEAGAKDKKFLVIEEAQIKLRLKCCNLNYRK